MEQRIAVIVIIIIMLVSLIGNAVLGFVLYSTQQELEVTKQSIDLHASVLAFADIFMSKVLLAQGEISFEDRLKIENAVRDTNDKDIYDQWQKFVNAKSPEEGQENVKDLLGLVINKLK